MATELIRILLVEDDPESIRTIWNLLHKKSRFQYHVEAVTGLTDAINRLINEDIDIVLLDLSLISHQEEMNSICSILEAQPHIALIVLTELENEQAGLRALEAGAQDYLLKEEIGSHALVRAIHYAVERHKAEMRIRLAEERHQATNNSITDYAIITLDPQGLITGWNTGAENIFGYRQSDIVGQSIALIFIEEDRAAGVPMRELIAAQEKGFATDKRWHLRKDGSRFYANGMTHPIYEGRGRVQGFVKIAHDETELKLRQTREREQLVLAEGLRDTGAVLSRALKLEEVLEKALDAARHLITFDAAVLILVENGKLTNLSSYGWSANEWETLEKWYKQQENLNTISLYQSATDTYQTVLMQNEQHLPVALGNMLLVVPLASENRVIGYLTFLKRKPDEFSETDVLKLEAFASQLVASIHNAYRFIQGQELAALQERNQFARDLHDSVSQTLYTASVIAQSLLKKWEQKSEFTPNLLSQLSQLIQGATAELRVLLLELRPTHVQLTPFRQLLQQLVQATQGRSNIDISLNFEGELMLPSEVHMTVYRIAQEAINNITKHSGATQAWISGHGEDRYLKLSIRDNGQGFPSNATSSGMGLKIMRERATEINASVEIHSEAGKGTEVHLVWRSKVPS